MNKKLLLSALGIACAVTNVSYGGFFQTAWKRALRPYRNIKRETSRYEYYCVPKGMIDAYRKEQWDKVIEKESEIWFERKGESLVFQIDGCGCYFPERGWPFYLIPVNELDQEIDISRHRNGSYVYYKNDLLISNFHISREMLCRDKCRKYEQHLNLNLPSKNARIAYKRFTVYHPWMANSLYYSLLAGICYGTYKLTHKETRDNIKNRVRNVMQKIKDRFKKQIALTTIDVSAKSPQIRT